MVEIITSAAALSQFGAEWAAFTERIPPPSPFQTPEWLLTWWSHFGSGELRVLVFRHDGDLTGILPMFLHEWNGRRQLTLVGTGISDDLDPLLDPQRAPAILHELRAELQGWRDWDLCDWQDLSAASPLLLLGTATDDTPATAIHFDQPFDNWLNARPADLRRNLRRFEKKAAETGTLHFAVADTGSPELLDALVQLHTARWRKAGEPGMIEANHSEAFLRDIAQVLGEEDKLRIFTLTLDGSIVAVIFAIRDQTTLYGYMSAFDPDYEKLGVGSGLLCRALRYAHENGYRRWHFLRGEEPYKFLWGAERIPRSRLVIHP